MPKFFLLAALVFIFHNLYSQQYKSKDILNKADSILIAKVGQQVFNDYYSYDRLSYYEFTNKRKKTKYRALTKDKITKGNFVKMRLRYDFCLKKFNHYCHMT